jgi:hypothetical protein
MIMIAVIGRQVASHDALADRVCGVSRADQARQEVW